MVNYAQINSDGKVIGVSQLTEELNDPNLILIDDFNTTHVGKIYLKETGEFINDPNSPIPEPEAPSELELLRLELEATQEAMDFLIMNGGM